MELRHKEVLVVFTVYDMDATKRLELLRKGINLDLYDGPVDRTSGRVTVCNGLFLRDRQRAGVKVRKNNDSHYVLVSREDQLDVVNREGTLYLVDVTVSGNKREVKSRIFKEQLSGVMATSLYGCELVNIDQACAFCATPRYTGPRFSVEEFQDGLEKLNAEEQVAALTISAGSVVSEQFKGYDQMAPYLRAAIKLGVRELNIELMPDQNISGQELGVFLQRVKSDGVTSIQCNIEIWNRKRALQLMPYKGKIPQETYLEWLGKATDVFGRGKASSVLLVGLNTIDELVEASQALIERGAVPSIEVFRPLPGTSLASYQPELDLEQTLAVVVGIRETISEEFDDGADFEGCLKCGGCSGIK